MPTTPQEVNTTPASDAIESEITVSITVNGSEEQSYVPCDLLLIDYLRDSLGLTGAKFGCETGQCGACTVLMNGVSVKSCTVLAAQADGAAVTTIEGVGSGQALTPLQTSFRENHAVQCGYCTPGFVLSLNDLLQRDAHPAESEIRHWIDGNLCRCGVYQNVVKAVLSLTAESK